MYEAAPVFQADVAGQGQVGSVRVRLDAEAKVRDAAHHAVREAFPAGAERRRLRLEIVQQKRIHGSTFLGRGGGRQRCGRQGKGEPPQIYSCYHMQSYILMPSGANGRLKGNGARGNKNQP